MKDIIPENNNIILYRTEDGNEKIEVKLFEENVWLTQAAMVELYATTKQNISLHLRNIFTTGEMEEEAVVKYYLTTASDGKKYKVKYYNLQAIIAVGYRVRSHRGTQFRRWATERLNEYLVKGFTLDDERLKNVQNIGSDYFDNLLERIRDIRSSEKRMYQKVRDIFKLAVDYDYNTEETREFFKIIQNKLHYAISGRTAAEIINERADASMTNMGLTSWHGSKVRKRDVTIAKNYYNKEELDNLNRIVTMYLDYAEDQAKRHKQVYMKQWREKLDAFLQFNEREILHNAGKVKKIVADKLAIEQYEEFNRARLTREAEQEDKEDFKQLEELEKSVIEKGKNE